MTDQLQLFNMFGYKRDKRECRCGRHMINRNIDDRDPTKYGKYSTIRAAEFYETKNHEVKHYFSKHSLTKCVY